MPRIKSSDHVETLERQQRELLARLKEAKAEARAAERERRAETARIAGAALLDELDEDPEGEAARALLILLNRRLTRKSDRARFGLLEASAANDDSAANAAPVEAAIGGG